MRHRQPPVQDDPSLVPNVPYFDLPAGLMAPLVKVSHLTMVNKMFRTVGGLNIVSDIFSEEGCRGEKH